MFRVRLAHGPAGGWSARLRSGYQRRQDPGGGASSGLRSRLRAPSPRPGGTSTRTCEPGGLAATRMPATRSVAPTSRVSRIIRFPVPYADRRLPSTVPEENTTGDGSENRGIAIAARMPMIATTTSSSINVKPLDFFRFILETLLILSPLAGWVLVCLDTCRDALAVVGSPRSKRGATGEKAQRSKGDGAKGHRFAVGMDGATSRLCVRACPAIGAKLTGGTIPSPAERKAHVGRHPQGSRRGGSGGAPAGGAGRPGTAGRGSARSPCNRIAHGLPQRRPHHR